MNTLAYPVTLTPDTKDGGFVVTFADVPEAITQGETVAESLQEAADCLEEAIAGRIRTGKPLPVPSPLTEGQYLVDVPAQTAVKALLYNAMQTSQLTQGELAKRIPCDKQEVKRLLDPRRSPKLSHFEAALRALGHRLIVRTV